MNLNGRNSYDSDAEPGSMQPLEAQIARALARAPRVAVPEDFAVSVTRRALALPIPKASMFGGWGPRLALGSGALLTVAMFALAPHAAPSLSSIPFDGELLLLMELSGLVLFANRLLLRD